MGKQGICVEIDGVFYESLRHAGRIFKCDKETIKNRCLSNGFPDYKIVPFRITYTKKKCKKCGIIKPLSKFRANSKPKNGYRNDCKSCETICRKKHHQENEERKKIYDKKYREDHKKEIRIYDKKYKKEHKEEANALRRKKRRTDITYKVNSNMSVAVWQSLKEKKNGAHWEDLVDYNCSILMAHLESKFTNGMSWDNYGQGERKWNIDHVIAKSKFNITSNTCQAFRDCWALDNLQPLWEVRNFEKGDKPMEPKYLIKPF